MVGPGFHRQVYECVLKVPRGFVTTYGDVAGALGARQVARHVGFALASLSPEAFDTPWHRVVNGRGMISIRGADARAIEQRARLESEGIHFSKSGRILDFETVRFVFERLPPSPHD